MNRHERRKAMSKRNATGCKQKGAFGGSYNREEVISERGAGRAN